MRRGDAGLLAVIAVGGAVGSVGRYAAGLAFPHADGGFPWSTFLVNLLGSLAMGVLVVWILSMARPHPWLRPFFGVGVLGGWTTFSGYALDIHAMVRAGSVGKALLYLVASLLLGLVAVGIGVTAGERLFGRRR
jgi:CrcB protein